MKKLILIIISFLIVQSSSAASFKELQVIPYDSANAENMKIWIPVEAKDCNVHIKILDSNMKLVRELLEEKILNGYYNIYWDKKDDSGNFVQEGKYNVATISCDFKRITPILVSFANGENAVLVSAGADDRNPSVEMTLLQDSLHVSLEIMNIRMNLTALIFSDSLILEDKASFLWEPSSVTPTGNYFYKLKVNDFEQLIPFWYRR